MCVCVLSFAFDRDILDVGVAVFDRGTSAISSKGNNNSFRRLTSSVSTAVATATTSVTGLNTVVVSILELQRRCPVDDVFASQSAVRFEFDAVILLSSINCLVDSLADLGSSRGDNRQ